MSGLKKTVLIMGLCFVVNLLPSFLSAQSAFFHPSPADSLVSRWAWAGKEAKQKGFKDGYWIGYSIERLMGENTYISTTGRYSFRGSFSHPSFLKGRTLSKFLYGKDSSVSLSQEEELKIAAKDALDNLENRRKTQKKVIKDVAILFRFGPGFSKNPETVRLSNLSVRFDPRGLPMLWLEKAKDGESVDFLRGLYEKKESEELKKKILSAVGIHRDSRTVVPFLEKVLNSGQAEVLRARAASELGEHDTEHVIKVLLHAVLEDRSYNVRKKAVYGLEDIDLPGATDALIETARKADHPKIRQRAVSCLGDKASKKAVSALEDFVYDDEDTEVQKRAVYALEDLPHGDGIPYLIKIAKSHPKSVIRKRAIYCLGDSSDPRALATLIEILKRK